MKESSQQHLNLYGDSRFSLNKKDRNNFWTSVDCFLANIIVLRTQSFLNCLSQNSITPVQFMLIYPWKNLFLGENIVNVVVNWRMLLVTCSTRIRSIATAVADLQYTLQGIQGVMRHSVLWEDWQKRPSDN